MNNQSDPVVSYEGSDLEALSTLRRYREWIMARFGPYLNGDALEVGAGIGNMTDHVIPFVSSLKLAEPSLNLIEKLRVRFTGASNMVIVQEDFQSTVKSTADKSFDSIIMVNVLEHIEDDATALSECHRILRPGGALLILVPALPFLFSKLDQIHGHFRRYKKTELAKGVRNAGLEIQEIRYFDFLGMVPWWLLNTIGGATEFNPRLVRIYDAVFVPITRTLESIVTPPAGKNIIVIAKRI